MLLSLKNGGCGRALARESLSPERLINSSVAKKRKKSIGSKR
jgi:hypothetical protein